MKFAKDLDGLIAEDQFVFGANMKWVLPFGMLLAACTIKQFRNKYAELPFAIECNTAEDGVSYASHMGFFKAISDKIDIGKELGEAIGNDNYIPITEIDLRQIHENEILNGRMIELGEVIEKRHPI